MPMPYRPLDVAQDEIRLLEIIPTKDAKFMHFRLRHYPLTQSPTFFAFSYTWGTPEKVHRIILDGHNFDVTENLFVALKQYLVHREQVHQALWEEEDRQDIVEKVAPHFIWVDALCINQEDFSERAAQVLRMGRIYQTSRMGVLLDLDSGSTETLLEATAGFDKGSALSFEDSQKSEKTWKAFSQLFSMPWFTRLWVIQEYVMAKRPCLYSDALPLQPKRLLAAILYILNADKIPLNVDDRVQLLKGAKQMMMIIQARKTIHELEPKDLLTVLLFNFRDCDATEPHDKIYALLGMIEFSNNRLVQLKGHIGEALSLLDTSRILIDYSAEFEEVCTSVVRAVVHQTTSLNIICACQSPGTFARSWVPNWCQAWHTMSFLAETVFSGCLMEATVGSSSAKSRYKASGARQSIASFPGDGLRLISGGIAWCEIAWLGDLKEPPISRCHLPINCHVHNMIDNLKSLGPALWDALSEFYGSSQKPSYERGSSRSRQDQNGSPTLHCESGMNSCGSNERTLNTLYEFTEAMCGGPMEDMKWPEYSGRYWHNFIPAARRELHELSSSFDCLPPSLKSGEDGVCAHVTLRITQKAEGRKAFVSTGGYCGLVPQHTQIGDQLCVLFGCDVPVVLRPIGGSYQFIGECYIHWLMEGEAIKALDAGRVKSQTFEIR
ncbi:hypothetical protein ACEPPN_017956 [Leptodophora sp. 'Broadleaf-Isolate-01']